MGGSFNYYARKVRNMNLPMSHRASALYSCVREFSGIIPDRPYISTLQHLRLLIGSNFRQDSEERHLLEALDRMEPARNQILELWRAFERARIRQKVRGIRVASKPDQQALLEAITAVRQKTNMLPIIDETSVQP